MRIHAIKDLKVSVKKKLTITASLTAVIVILVITYKKLEPKFLRFLKTKKRLYRKMKKRAINKEIEYEKYIDTMIEIRKTYESEPTLWI
ncbi:hypothetical protein [Albibacterium bauzanense]|uniref:Uncharacterized protein n=1 Tax=Albibacterium bauzanense TaxID=653929 RepID=A0A4R1LWN6_9SPHI|nr:hypothetical protein [Albibacterium bauzanense]TCK83585.1 hypothetical protein C8N28_2187 [Albibacterium bauzanense]